MAILVIKQVSDDNLILLLRTLGGRCVKMDLSLHQQK